MILPGLSLVARKIVDGTISSGLQTQPCGVDLTLKKIFKWNSAGTVDLDNSFHQNSSTEEIPFVVSKSPVSQGTSTSSENYQNTIDLLQGSYLVEFNETVSIPLDAMGQIFVRSSLFRSGALVNAGVVDSGYNGVIGALLQVVNPAGIRLHENARLAQFVCYHMSEPVERYNGIYQGSTAMG